MNPYYQDDQVTLLLCDALDQLCTLPELDRLRAELEQAR